MRTPRMTQATQLVLDGFLRDEAAERHGYEIGAEAGLPSGTVHPILARLEAIGWLESRWEDIDESYEGRRARRYYRLTPDGLEKAPAALVWARSRSSRVLRPKEA